jgi:DNA-binding IclR family transcriptional regulator
VLLDRTRSAHPRNALPEPRSRAHATLSAIADRPGVSATGLVSVLSSTRPEISRLTRALAELGLVRCTRAGRFSFWKATERGLNALAELAETRK